MAPLVAPCRRVLAYPFIHTTVSPPSITQDHAMHVITAFASAGFKRYGQQWRLLLPWLLVVFILDLSLPIATANTNASSIHHKFLVTYNNQWRANGARRVWDPGIVGPYRCSKRPCPPLWYETRPLFGYKTHGEADIASDTHSNRRNNRQQNSLHSHIDTRHHGYQSVKGAVHPGVLMVFANCCRVNKQVILKHNHCELESCTISSPVVVGKSRQACKF